MFTERKNAANSLSSSVFLDDNSDSDTSTGEVPEYYQPISPANENDEEQEEDGDDWADQANHAADSEFLENGHCFAHEAQVQISSLHLDDDEIQAESSDSAMVRAFVEDENRRNAPLTPKNSSRVMEAMPGISFGGSAPDWAGEITETQWIDRLGRLRQMPQP